jgi:uncharacterized protein
VVVLEHDGSFYSCDHFVDDAHRVGGIEDTPLEALLTAPSQVAFGLAKRDSLPRQCCECDVLPMCNGGCPKDRFATASDGEAGLNYLCPAFKRFFTHALPWAVRVAADRVPAGLQSRVATGVGRNDPCPCGSGKKFKKCCS